MPTRDPADRITILEAIGLHDVAHLSVREGLKRLQSKYDLDIDGLTKLASHPQFNRRLGEIVEDPNTRDIVVLHIDLDNFKAVNDTLGHENGNQFLRAIADRLTAFPYEGLWCRSGGDEFPVAFANVGSKAEAVALAFELSEWIRGEYTVADVRTRRRGKKVRWDVSPSIGVFWTDNPEQTLAKLSQQRRNPHMAFLDRADSATAYAKQLPRHSGHRVVHYSAEQQRQIMRRQHHEDQLRRTMQDRDMTRVYQAIVNLRSRDVYAYETMVRLGKSSGSRRTLERNIALMETWPEIDDMFDFMLEGACRDLAPLGKHISVNMAVAQLLSDGVLGDVMHITELCKTDPEKVIIEVSERHPIPVDEDMHIRLDALKQLGVGLSIDDFGIGHANTERIQHFPQFGNLKLDKSIVQDIPRKRRTLVVARSIVALAHDLDMTVTAEGIENKRQLEASRQLGCDYGQGYFIAQPLPLEGILAAI